MKNLTETEQLLFNGTYTRCEFDDECDVCEKPEGGSYAVGLFEGEADSYICKKCAIKSIPTLVKQANDDDEYYRKLREKELLYEYAPVTIDRINAIQSEMMTDEIVFGMSGYKGNDKGEIRLATQEELQKALNS